MVFTAVSGGKRREAGKTKHGEGECVQTAGFGGSPLTVSSQRYRCQGKAGCLDMSSNTHDQFFGAEADFVVVGIAVFGMAVAKRASNACCVRSVAES